MKVEIDINGGSNYVHVGTSQMMSVPYALYAENANNINMDSISNYLMQDSIFNTSFGGGSGCDFLFPDGYNVEGVYLNLGLFPNGYTVPPGKRFYVTNISDNFWIDQTIHGNPTNFNFNTNEQLRSLFILNSGQNIGNYSYSLATNKCSGFLIDESPNITAINMSLSSDYTVPDKKKLYLLSNNNNGTVKINGVNYDGSFVVVSSGDILSPAGTLTNYYGYLADENYFADCGGGGFGGSSSTANVNLDYDSLANILVNNSAFLSSISPSGKTVFGDFETVSHDIWNN